MAVTKEIVELESSRTESSVRGDIHLWKEGTFMRAYEWSAWLCCRYLHDFKVTKRSFKGIENPVAFIGFPETSLGKWLPEGAAETVVGEKHLLVTLPDVMLSDSLETMQADFAEWKNGLPLTEAQGSGPRKAVGGSVADDALLIGQTTLTGIMQRILVWPIENKSLFENTKFLSDIKCQLASLV